MAGLFLTAALLLSLRCVNPFAPRLTESLEASDLVVTPQRSPEEVLQNFKVAYNFRDSLLYSDLLDSTFLFVFFNPDEGTSGQFVSWDREVDLKTTGRLFRHFQIVELIWNATIYGVENADTGELSKGFNLTLVGTESDYKLTGRAVFSFRRCHDEKWRITRWKDESEL